MITTEGKAHIKRYMAGYVPAIGQAIAFGIGATAENVADICLNLESGRTEILLTTYDFVTDAVVYKASIPEDYVGKIYEVGLYSTMDNMSAGSFGSRTITTFDSATEPWLTGGVAATYTTTNTRIGDDSLNQTPPLSTTATSVLGDVALDFSGDASGDTFLFAFNNANTNVNTIAFRFKVDASNYYTYTITNPAAGYQIASVTKGSLVATGTPNWNNITTLEVATNSKAAGASNVDFDSIRIEDKASTNLDYILVARKVLASPVTKIDGRPLDIEFSLEVGV